MFVPILFVLKSAMVKFAPQANIEFFIFIRFFFDFLLLAPFFLRNISELRSEQLYLQGVRALFVVFAIWFSTYGIRHLALVDAVLLENTLPLFLPLVAWIWHREKISFASGLCLLLGFSSLFFLLKPKFDLFRLAALAPLVASFLTAVTSVCVRTLSKTDSPLTILFYYNLFSGLLALGPCIYCWEPVPFAFTFWWPFVMISVLGVCFQYMLVKAYSLVPAYVVGSIIYSGVLYSALIGFFFWGETLDEIQMLGGVILIISGLLVLQENRKKQALLKKSGQTA